MSGPVDVLAAWDAMADSIANRRDECIERGQNVQAELYRDMIAGHRAARAAVAELVEAVRGMPDDVGMVYDDPDEGARYSCCYRPYQYAQYRHPSRPDPNRHAPDCWYPSLRAALAKFARHDEKVIA